MTKIADIKVNKHTIFLTIKKPLEDIEVIHQYDKKEYLMAREQLKGELDGLTAVSLSDTPESIKIFREITEGIIPEYQLCRAFFIEGGIRYSFTDVDCEVSCPFVEHVSFIETDISVVRNQEKETI